MCFGEFLLHVYGVAGSVHNIQLRNCPEVFQSGGTNVIPAVLIAAQPH